jgi:hypothetical protein
MVQDKNEYEKLITESRKQSGLTEALPISWQPQ